MNLDSGLFRIIIIILNESFLLVCLGELETCICVSADIRVCVPGGGGGAGLHVQVHGEEDEDDGLGRDTQEYRD